MNEEKFNILFSKNTVGQVKKQIKQVLEIKEMRPQSIYLGNSLVLGNNKRKEFCKIKKKVLNRVQGWNAQLLSKAGKTTLIKNVAQSIHFYTMSTFVLFKSLCNELDSIIWKFWWQVNSNSLRYLAFKNWKDIRKQKNAGGLGFRWYSDFNTSLLSKLMWMIANDKNSL